jgi:hypothetical protein
MENYKMSKCSKSRDFADYLTSKPIIIVSLFIALLAVFIVLLDEVSTGNIGHSQIMPANSSSSGRVIENSTLSDLAEEKNITSSQPSVNDKQNSGTSGILSNSSLITTSMNSTDNLENATKTQNPLPQVKIISHTKDQKVSEGTLSINGVSSDDSASTCDVYVILNGIKPYQRVTPTGQSGSINGTKDYSLWKFTLLPTYGLISEGDNKMTAKITCMNGSLNATKFNSLNVTGVSSTPTNTSASLTQTPVPLQSSENSSENATTTDNLDPVQGNSTSLMTTTSAPTNSQQQAPATQSITPQTPQTPRTNYNGISPSSPLSDEIPTQYSSSIQQEEQVPANNNISVLEADIESDSDETDSIERDINLRTKEAVDRFVAKVQGTVEERLEEAINMRTPFELVTPTPFDSEDVNDSNNDDDDDSKQEDN